MYLLFLIQEQEGIKLINGSYVNGNIYCKYSRNQVTTVQNHDFNLGTTQYHLLLAAGSSLRGTLRKSFRPCKISTLYWIELGERIGYLKGEYLHVLCSSITFNLWTRLDSL